MDSIALAYIRVTSFLSCGAGRFARKRKAQTTVEYLLMLAVVGSLAMMFGSLFYKKILGAFFTIVGLTIGGGRTPSGTL